MERSCRRLPSHPLKICDFPRRPLLGDWVNRDNPPLSLAQEFLEDHSSEELTSCAFSSPFCPSANWW
jgi:hypothetical protein